MTRFDYDDSDVVVVVGSGAGGGTVANELCQRGIRTVVLEAGPHLTGRRLPPGRVARVRPDGLGRPAHHVRQLEGRDGLPEPAGLAGEGRRRDHHPLGRCVPAVQAPRARRAQCLRRRRRRGPARLADRAVRAGAVLRQGRDQDGGHAPPRPSPAAREQQLQGVRERRREAGLQVLLDRPLRHERRAVRRAPGLGAGRLQLPGRQAGLEVVHARRRAAQGRGHRQPRPALRLARHPDPARRVRPRHRRALRRPQRCPAPPACLGGVRGRQRDRVGPAVAAVAVARNTRTGSPTRRARWAATTCDTPPEPCGGSSTSRCTCTAARRWPV